MSKYLEKHNVKNSAKNGKFVRKGAGSSSSKASKKSSGSGKTKKGFWARRRERADAKGREMDRENVEWALRSGKTKRAMDSYNRVYELKGGNVVQTAKFVGGKVVPVKKPTRGRVAWPKRKKRSKKR